MYAHVEEPTEVFTDGLRIKEIRAGWHHNLLLGEDGELYGFGARVQGQMTGKPLEDRQEQCSIARIALPESDSPIVEV